MAKQPAAEKSKRKEVVIPPYIWSQIQHEPNVSDWIKRAIIEKLERDRS